MWGGGGLEESESLAAGARRPVAATRGQWRHQAPCAELGEARGGAERTTASPTTSFLRPLVSNTPPPVSFL